MFIGLDTRSLATSHSAVTRTIIGLCVLAHVILWQAGRQGMPSRLDLAVGWHGFEPWQPLTSLFVHGGLWHLAFNCMALWIFGPAVETRLGLPRFLILYFGGGLASAGLFMLLWPGSSAIGASGAVSAVAAAFAIMFPRTPASILGRPTTALWLVGLYFVLDIVGELSSQAGFGNGIAHSGHIGGSLFGAAMIGVLFATRSVPRTELDALFMLKQWRRRRALRRSVQEHGTAFEATNANAPTARRVASRGHRSEPEDDPEAATRRAIVAALRRDDTEAALRLFTSGSGDPRLAETDLADLGNRAMSVGETDAAIRAYRALLDRRGERPYGDAGPTDDFRLLLATLLVRRAARPDEARPLLDRLATSTLDEQAATLRDALITEVGDAGSGDPA